MTVHEFNIATKEMFKASTRNDDDGRKRNTFTDKIDKKNDGNGKKIL